MSSILRKLKVLAVAISDEALLEWVDREVKGYAGVPLDDYPEYRVFKALNKGNFLGIAGSQMKNVEVHSLGLPDYLRDFASKLWIDEPIGEIERMALAQSDNWQEPWPADWVAAFAAQFFQNYRAMQVWKVVPSSALEYVLSTVRECVLDFLLDLEGKNPNLSRKESALDEVTTTDSAAAASILIDNKAKQKRGPDSPKNIKPVKVFISYSHKDELYRQELENHIRILSRRGLISVWHDRKIGAGRDWEGEIDSNLDTADIVLLLISSDFIASDYCYDKEVDKALDNHDLEKSIVIPVILRSAHLEGSKFMHLQALPTDAKAISSWQDRDEAYTVVARGLEGVIVDR
ncbi:TIR domain-containing protein, partial [Deinococcus sp.]|uniref:AbiTii domain-containing protein n=1 Tax=Deinococcus sp. TaxID=47478 RepID=UPI0025BA8E03